MGCDAHAFLEGKPARWPHWRLLAQDLHIDRDYLLFAVAAQVRGEGLLGPGREILKQAIGNAPAPKGLPEDWAARIAQPIPEGERSSDLECWVRAWSIPPCDGHSHTWLSWEEMENVDLRYFLSCMDMPGRKPAHNTDWEAILSYGSVYVRQGWDVRLILWFDN